MTKRSVYSQLTAAPSDLFDAMRREIGVKTACTPFARKAIAALSTLDRGMSEAEATKAANAFFDSIQTLAHGGILPEDYDLLDFVKRGNAVTVSARVDAFIRVAARKGYRIVPDITAVPAEDGGMRFCWSTAAAIHSSAR